MKRLLLLLTLTCSALPASADIRSLLQMVDYMGVDYAEAVQNGQIINPAEYAEMTEFARRINEEIAELEPTPVTLRLRNLGENLDQSVIQRSSTETVAELTQRIREELMAGYEVVLTPRQQPDLKAAANLYAQQCASCHGVEGKGDGQVAANLEPPPTDFTDLDRAHQRTLFGLYNTITLGVEGTSMVGRPDLTDAERWSLAFHVGAMHVDAALAAQGETAFQQAPVDLETAVTQTPRNIAESRPDGAAINAWIRMNPAVLFRSKPDPIAVARQNLTQSLAFYSQGDTEAARQHAIRAYLEGFELVEAPLSNLDMRLMRETEQAMMNYRQALSNDAGTPEVQALYDEALAMLDQAGSLLSSGGLLPGVAFAGSLIILLREGLEAILLVAAIIAFLSRSGNREGLKYVHAGWISALVAGGATWILATYLIDISGATRELTEGFAALTAAVILLYVGFWMHRHADATRWNQYLQTRMQAAMTSRTLWALCVVAFLAVYREIFETILFYQALWTQVDDNAQSAVFYGGGLALALLIVVSWGITRYSLRLPLRQFFLGSAVFMIALAFIFTGKGVAALQEAGKLPLDPVSFVTIDVLGIYPNSQALSLQALVLILVAAAVLYNKYRHPLVTVRQTSVSDKSVPSEP